MQDSNSFRLRFEQELRDFVAKLQIFDANSKFCGGNLLGTEVSQAPLPKGIKGLRSALPLSERSGERKGSALGDEGDAFRAQRGKKGEKRDDSTAPCVGADPIATLLRRGWGRSSAHEFGDVWACSLFVIVRADTGVCPYRWLQSIRPFSPPFYKCFLEDAKHIKPCIIAAPYQGALNLPLFITGRAFLPLQLTRETATKPKKKSFFRTQIRFFTTEARRFIIPIRTVF